jgi:hypothetical protein
MKGGSAASMELTLYFSPERKHDLEQLQTITGASLEELFNNALSVFEWAVNESRAQNEIASVNERDESYRVLINQLLQRVAASVSRAA